MSSRQFKVLTCDRCHATEEIREAHQEYNWAKIACRTVNGPFSINAHALVATASASAESGADLCPACTKALADWWKNAPSLPDSATIARLMVALQPFASFADPTGRFPADKAITDGSGMARKQLTMRDCYSAKAVLEGKEP